MCRRVLACPDKFRGSLSAREVCEAIAAAARSVGAECTPLPLADGGEGTLDVFGGPNRLATVSAPLEEPCSAPWRYGGEVAVIEAARACGLALVGGASGNRPLDATTRGVGELIAIAAHEGATRILLGVGGSATTDGGMGAVQALADAGLDLHSDVEVVVCCDVNTHFTCAAEVFAPQKGASDEQVRTLTARLHALREKYLASTGVDVDTVGGSGAAGGLAGGLAAAGAVLRPGFPTIAEYVGLAAAIGAADLVVTGEGCVDEGSFDGKVVGGVLEQAAAQGKPALVICGTAKAAAADVPLIDLTALFGEKRSWDDTAACVRDAFIASWTG